MGGEIVLWRVPLRWFGPVLLGLGFQIVLQLGREHVLSQRLLYLVDQPDSQDRLGILARNLGNQLIGDFIVEQSLRLRTVALGHCCNGHRTSVHSSSHDPSTLKTLTGFIASNVKYAVLLVHHSGTLLLAPRI